MFSNSIVALITPFKKNGNICNDSLKKMLSYHIRSNTSSILAIGTTGEYLALRKLERLKIVSKIVSLTKNKIPVIAGINSNNIKRAISMINMLENSGIVGYVISAPYYSCPTQEGIYRYFKSISDNTDLYQIIYNVPYRTGVDILPKTIIKLSSIDKIIGVKEASGDLSRISLFKNNINKKFYILSGNDKNIIDFMRLGGDGVISVIANIAAHEMSNICDLITNKKFEEAYFLYRTLSKVCNCLSLESNPSPIKWIANYLGLISTNFVRSPLVALSKDMQLLVKRILEKTKLSVTNYK